VKSFGFVRQQEVRIVNDFQETTMSSRKARCISRNETTVRLACVALLMTVFALSAQIANAQSFQVIHNFTGAGDGAAPRSGLTMDAGGNFYGTTSAGGTANLGTAYRLKRAGSGWTLSPLFIFTGNDSGGTPYGRLTIAADGTLYGTTTIGGNENGGCHPLGCGIIFCLTPPPTPPHSALTLWNQTSIVRFGQAQGKAPMGDLIFDPSGNIFGATPSGGRNQYYGAIYQVTHSSGGWAVSVLYNADDEDPAGYFPHSGVVLDNGNLYGDFSDGGPLQSGTFFELSPNGTGWTEQTIHDFDPAVDGSFPVGGLVRDSSGNYFGTTSSGGVGNGGTVFELARVNGGWTFSVLYSFSSAGQNCGPSDTLSMDAAGTLYGTTRCGGQSANGSVFKLTPSNGGWTFTSLHDFGGPDGAAPNRVVLDAGGNLFGTTYAGGATGSGVIFEIAQ
jgi:uncharacterized repeat protein (TIGR03803 family)